jgi:hypothetical protein
MSIGFEGRGLKRKLSNSKDSTNLNQVVVGNKDTAIEAAPPFVQVLTI